MDMENTYDHVIKFLLEVLETMEDGKRWIHKIGKCISTPKFSVLVDGTLSRFFQSSIELR